MDDLTLSGRVAVVTGGSRGIGGSIALALARRGAAVAVCYRDREDAGLETASLVRAEGVKAFAGRCDVGDEASVEEFFGRVRSELGPIDILVNNAGIIRDGLLVLMKRAQWADVLTCN